MTCSALLGSAICGVLLGEPALVMRDTAASEYVVERRRYRRHRYYRYRYRRGTRPVIVYRDRERDSTVAGPCEVLPPGPSKIVPKTEAVNGSGVLEPRPSPALLVRSAFETLAFDFLLRLGDQQRW
jgi:hypothetical protein